METKLGIGDVFGRTVELVRANAALFLVMMAIMVVVSSAGDILLGDESAMLSLPIGIASLFVQYETTRRLLAHEGLMFGEMGRIRFLALFGLCFVTNAAILLGLLALVLPGLYLMARWSISVPVLIGDDVGINEAMGTSWERTRAHALPIAAVFTLVFLPVFAIAIMLGALTEISQAGAAALSIALNLVVYAGVVFGWFVSVAIHAMLAPREAQLAEIFA
jgi:hypothetical protein